MFKHKFSNNDTNFSKILITLLRMSEVINNIQGMTHATHTYFLRQKNWTCVQCCQKCTHQFYFHTILTHDGTIVIDFMPEKNRTRVSENLLLYYCIIRLM